MYFLLFNIVIIFVNGMYNYTNTNINYEIYDLHIIDDSEYEIYDLHIIDDSEYEIYDLHIIDDFEYEIIM